MKTLLYRYLIVLLFFPTLAIGQVDSVVLNVDKLSLENIRPAEKKETNQLVYAATRTNQALKEIPFTVHVITKDEIRDNGYRTLVDALKMAPGIRVSQPGNALEGETFLMRGLIGNTYTRILLNGNPIKPVVVRGMPIGAQLPIQQAERIEIIYGATGTLYGVDASAGVINIVLEETERPVYTQANLSVGTNEYTNLDISFGGRLGKQKNTLRYALYGSYTFRDDLRIQHDNDSLFNPLRYFNGNLDFSTVQNYLSIDDQPLINDLPHQSRLVGIKLAYRAMTFSAEGMFRRDHSSIGLNPLAVSYSNPLNYIGERLINGNFTLKKDYRRFGFDFRAGYLQYQMDSRSSSNYIYNYTGELLDELTWLSSFDSPTSFNIPRYDSLTSSYYQQYFNGTRFHFSESHDFQTDLIFRLFPQKKIDLSAGLLMKAFVNVPIVNYSRVPLGSSFFANSILPATSTLSPFRSQETNGFQVNAFTQALWSHKKWTFVAGLNWMRSSENFTYRFFGSFTDVAISSLDYRLGANYQPNKNWSVRASYGTAVQLPSAYYRSNTLRIEPDVNFPLKLNVAILEEEKSYNAEVGFRWTPSKELFFDVSGFHTQYRNLISPFQNVRTNPQGVPDRYIIGYVNSDSSRINLYGIQSSYVYKSSVFDFIFNLTYHFGNEKILGFEDQSSISQLPRMIRKTRIVFRPTKRISLTFDTIVNGKAKNKVKNDNRNNLTRFRNIDVLVNYNINRNFRVFYKIRNIFSREYAGLNAYGTFDDLIYNPQELRTFRLGMSYRID